MKEIFPNERLTLQIQIALPPWVLGTVHCTLVLARETMTCKCSQTQGGALRGVPAESDVICTVAGPSFLLFHMEILQVRLHHNAQGYIPADGGTDP